MGNQRGGIQNYWIGKQKQSSISVCENHLWSRNPWKDISLVCYFVTLGHTFLVDHDSSYYKHHTPLSLHRRKEARMTFTQRSCRHNPGHLWPCIKREEEEPHHFFKSLKPPSVRPRLLWVNVGETQGHPTNDPNSKPKPKNWKWKVYPRRNKKGQSGKRVDKWHRVRY